MIRADISVGNSFQCSLRNIFSQIYTIHLLWYDVYPLNWLLQSQFSIFPWFLALSFRNRPRWFGSEEAESFKVIYFAFCDRFGMSLHLMASHVHLRFSCLIYRSLSWRSIIGLHFESLAYTRLQFHIHFSLFCFKIETGFSFLLSVIGFLATFVHVPLSPTRL